MRLAVGLALAALLGACTTTPLAVRPGCSAVALTPVEPEPVVPPLTEAQRMAFYRAAFPALGEALTIAWVKAVEVQVPAWGRRQAARLEAQRVECLAPPQ